MLTVLYCAATIGPPGILPVSQATTDPENMLGTIITQHFRYIYHIRIYTIAVL